MDEIDILDVPTPNKWETVTGNITPPTVIKWFPKNEVLDNKKTVFIRQLKQSVVKGKNLFQLELSYSKNSDVLTLELSDTNLKELINAFGVNVNNWLGQKVYLSGSEWKGTINGVQKTGVQLSFSL